MSKIKGAKNGTTGSNIDKKIFEAFCSIFCTEEEIANYFGVSHDTIGRYCQKEYGKPFNEVINQFNNKGKISLRRIQFHLAEKNVTMAIWLGKQYLGQKDAVEVSGSEKINIINDIPKNE